MPQILSFSRSDFDSAHPLNPERRRSVQGCSKILTWLTVIGLSCLYSDNHPAWGAVGSDDKRAIVAAGFGYQMGAVSAIAVKVYDAESGAILTDEVYELTVKEGEGTGGGREPRIFAGGVGQGATDLSNFMLRVYDANTGTFQWEGRLNLVQPEGKGEGKVTSATIAQRAIVMKTQAVEKITEQPVFLLRALDAVTGSLVWEDEFTTTLKKQSRIQPIADRVSINSDHTFEFRIRMYDKSGQRVLWEDQLSRREFDQGAQESFSDQAQFLPVWPHLPQEESPAESI